MSLNESSFIEITIREDLHYSWPYNNVISYFGLDHDLDLIIRYIGWISCTSCLI